MKRETMVVLTATTPEEFVFEQLQQMYGLNEAQASEFVVGLKAKGLYADLLIKAKAAMEEFKEILE